MKRKTKSCKVYSMPQLYQNMLSNIFAGSVPLQASIADDDDGKPSGKGAVAAGGFTILSEKKLFLGQKVCTCILFPCFLYSCSVQF